MSAPLGDDVLGDDPTVTQLEEKVAALLGMEAALFVPSGTMANQLAIRCHCEHGDEIIGHGESHIIHYETGAPAALSGCMIKPLSGPGGLFDATSVRGAIRNRDVHSPMSKLLLVENTHNRGGGSIWPLAQFQEVAAVGAECGLSVHIDGARLWNASVGAGYSPRDFVSHSHSVSVCFSKGLGAPAGSALAGKRQLIDRARRFRKMFGGAMRQSGILAAAAIYALDHHFHRLAEDHKRARLLAERLRAVALFKVNPAPELVESNMVFFELDEQLGSASDFCARLAGSGVRMIPMGPQKVRAVLHLDVPNDFLDTTMRAIDSVLAATR